MACCDHDRLLRAFSALLAPLAAAGCGPGIATGTSVSDGDTSAGTTWDGWTEGEAGSDGTASESGTTGGGGSIDPMQFDTDICDPDESRILAAVAPAEPFDYAERRWAERIDWGGDTEPEWSDPYVGESVGERCGGATDLPACEEAWASLPLESVWQESGFDGVGFRSVAFTRGDMVEAITDLPALNAFLGPLDAAGDAALLAVMEGHRLLCAEGNDVGVTDEGYILHTTSGGGCGEGDDIEQHVVLVRPDGTIEVLETILIEKGDPGCSVGRLPAGLCRRPRVARQKAGAVGAFFADVAHLEAAAVTAFGQLARELSLHGAPRGMVSAALRSRRDEIRHARTVARLARRHGARPIRPRVDPTSPRRLVDVAADNAAEGCIRETYGALVAHVQARRASDPVVRRALARIAGDETRHAVLSWKLARWTDAHMRPSERAEVARRARHALERLELELTGAFDDRVHDVAGLPHADEARRLFGGLRDALWS